MSAGEHRQGFRTGSDDLRISSTGVAFLMTTSLTVVPLQYRATIAAIPSNSLAERFVDSRLSYCLVSDVALIKILI